MIEKRYRQFAFILITLFIVGIGLVMFRIELGMTLSVIMFLCFTILGLHWMLIGLWEEEDLE